MQDSQSQPRPLFSWNLLEPEPVSLVLCRQDQGGEGAIYPLLWVKVYILLCGHWGTGPATMGGWWTGTGLFSGARPLQDGFQIQEHPWAYQPSSSTFCLLLEQAGSFQVPSTLNEAVFQNEALPWGSCHVLF
jgi:hypothetical protein